MHNTYIWALERIHQNGSGFDVKYIICLYLLHISGTDYLCKLYFVFILQEERFFVINMDQTKFLGRGRNEMVRGTLEKSICDKTSRTNKDTVTQSLMESL